MRNKNGFTVIEIILSFGILSMIMVNMTFLVHKFFLEKKNIDIWSDTQIELNGVLANLNNEIRNAIKLFPYENLTSAINSEYHGVTSLAEVVSPSVCKNDENFSVVRYTSLIAKQKSEVLRRPWAEKVSVDVTGVPNELRVSLNYSDGIFSDDSKFPAEVVLIDADMRFIRRYKVGSYNKYLNTSIDPYTNATVLDGNGNPILHNYVGISLKTPHSASLSPIEHQPAVFVTNSDAYGAKTSVLCVHATEGSLIRYDTNSKEFETLIQARPDEFKISQFKVGYLGTTKTSRVDTSFYKESVDELKDPECLNVLLVSLELTASDKLKARMAELDIQDSQSSILRNKIIFPHNLNVKRPAYCELD